MKLDSVTAQVGEFRATVENISAVLGPDPAMVSPGSRRDTGETPGDFWVYADLDGGRVWVDVRNIGPSLTEAQRYEITLRLATPNGARLDLPRTSE